MKNKTFKVMTVVGTRPEIIRLSRIISKFDYYFDHILVHTGQNYDYDLNEIFFKDLKIRKPDYFLNSDCTSPMSQVSDIIKKIDELLDDIPLDAVLILGDTNSSLSAIPFKRKKIPIFHMEAGNRCFNYNVPEEINRKIVDVISDVNLTYSDISREHLICENIPHDRIIVTGSPLKEVLNFYMQKILKSNILKKLNLKKNQYYLFSLHREENVDSEINLKCLSKILQYLTKNHNKEIIFPLHPRTKKNLNKFKIKLPKNIKILSPLGFCDFVKLQINSFCVLSDSGSITEESSILNFRAINLRNEHERPEGFKEASVIFTGLNLNLILNAINILEESKLNNNKIVQDYNVENVSDKMIKIVLSYSHYIKNKVWNLPNLI